MNFNRKDVFIGLVIIVVVVLGAILYKRLKAPKVIPSPAPQTVNYKEELENIFNLDIPENTNTINLKDVSGGNARGIATSSEVLVDIEDPENGYFYQGWLEDGGKLISLGKLQIAKGGWLLEYDGSKYPSYKKIIISLEKKLDSTLEKRILEGSF
ncbi:MAG TPA: hypothetical protein VI795_01415 [Patescibacteria group bacterium]|nr:hypothetical protein [Patescibacteria group bacterium]